MIRRYWLRKVFPFNHPDMDWYGLLVQRSAGLPEKGWTDNKDWE